MNNWIMLEKREIDDDWSYRGKFVRERVGVELGFEEWVRFGWIYRKVKSIKFGEFEVSNENGYVVCFGDSEEIVLIIREEVS